MNEQILKEYCTGCGLCQSLYGVTLVKDEKGFPYPESFNETAKKELINICPAGGKFTEYLDQNALWGKYSAVYVGWSSNEMIRNDASSGGIITAACCYLIENHYVDGIIQTHASKECVYGTETVVSKTQIEVLSCMGSRYSISSPLNKMEELLKTEDTYAFVGKPCDVLALRMFLKNHPEFNDRIKYIFSFFCAGEPSDDAQKKLLTALNCNDDCESLRYRGNGWPGYASVLKKDGTTSRMTYNESWGHILGRDVRKACRYCLDGIGEFADISCGDAWYITNDGYPDFSENKGRNVIFARNQKGLDLLLEMKNKNVIQIEDYNKSLTDLKIIQKYQYERRCSMHSMLMGLRICGFRVPKYDRKLIRGYAKNLEKSKQLRRLIGTIKRNLKRKN